MAGGACAKTKWSFRLECPPFLPEAIACTYFHVPPSTLAKLNPWASGVWFGERAFHIPGGWDLVNSFVPRFRVVGIC